MVEKNTNLPKLPENLKANIGIVGYGFVGKALSYGFYQDHILYYDKYQKSHPLKKVVDESEFIFICLPTPMFADESGIDLSIIEENIAKITPQTDDTDKIIVIKSTVVPGTTERLEKEYPKTKFCFNPEFLTEAHFKRDFINPDRVIIGASNDLVSRRLVVFYQDRLPDAPIFQTSPTTAELVKYGANAYLAMKVIFANQFKFLCDALGVEWPEVKKLIVADNRIGDTHLDVHEYKGFGGKCFPKDLVALVAEADKRGVDLSLLKEVWKINKNVRQKYDWVEIPFATSEKAED